jgi:hypothetical protein
MTYYIFGLHGMLALATNGNSPLIVADEILVGNGGFCGFTHLGRGYILHNTEYMLNGYWENPIAGNGLDVAEIETGYGWEPLNPTTEFLIDNPCYLVPDKSCVLVGW